MTHRLGYMNNTRVRLEITHKKAIRSLFVVRSPFPSPPGHHKIKLEHLISKLLPGMDERVSKKI